MRPRSWRVRLPAACRAHALISAASWQPGGYGGGDSGRTQGARDRHDHGLRLQKQKVWAAAIQVRDHREQQKQTQEGHSWPLPEWRAPTE